MFTEGSTTQEGAHDKKRKKKDKHSNEDTDAKKKRKKEKKKDKDKKKKVIMSSWSFDVVEEIGCYMLELHFGILIGNKNNYSCWES